MTQLRRLPLAVLPLATFSFAAPAAAATVPFAAAALVEDDLDAVEHALGERRRGRRERKRDAHH